MKFQSYVRLGVAAYNDRVEQYIKAENSNAPNRIGLDALLEVLVARKQMEEMGVSL